MSSIGFNSLANSSQATSPAAQFLSLLNNSASSPTTAAAVSGDVGTDSTSGVSSFSQLLSKLQKLSQSDPAKFQSLTAQIASELKTAAGKATGAQAQALNNLSAEFTQASKDGNLSALEPSRPQQSGGAHRHHHHGGGAEAYQANATTDTASSNPSSSTESVLQNILNQVKPA